MVNLILLTGVLLKLLRMLRQEGIVTEDLSLPDDWSELELCYRGLCRKDSYSRRRRIGMKINSQEDMIG